MQALAKLVIVGIQIFLPLPDRPDQSFVPGVSPGTRVYLCATAEDRSFVKLDRAASRLGYFRDDTGTDLVPPVPGDGEATTRPAGDAHDWLDSWARVSEDGKRISFAVRSPRVPAPGASKLLLKGAAALVWGRDLRTERSDLVTPPTPTGDEAGPADGPGDAPAAGAGQVIETDAEPPAAEPKQTISVAGIEMTVESVQPANLGMVRLSVVLSGPRELDAVKDLVFLDAEGQAIPHHALSSVRAGLPRQQTYLYTFGLRRKVESFRIETTYYAELERELVGFEHEIDLAMERVRSSTQPAPAQP